MTLNPRRTASTLLAVLLLPTTFATLSCNRKNAAEEGITHKDDYQLAYTYAFPMIANYKAMYEYFVNKSSSQYKGPFNTVVSDPHVYTPKDTAVVTPNADTPYSFLQADLRAEPIVFCVPDIEKTRYYSVQLTDLYTFNYGYVSSRATGNVAGCYMITGPGWVGPTPKGILKVFASETQFTLLIYRTQLFGPDDINNVKRIQAGYTLQPLSSYAQTPPPPLAPSINFPAFTDDAFKRQFPAFLNFLLQFCPEVPEEAAVRLRFAAIGIGPGKPFDYNKLTDGQKGELDLAIKDGYDAIVRQRDSIGKNINGWIVGSAFGGRDFYHGDFLLRAAAAMAGIYGNDAEEAMYPMTRTDTIGTQLDGSKHNYTLTFRQDVPPPGISVNSLPPVNAFWSVTMYDSKTQLLVENPINRYLINSPMLPSLKKNSDGSLTIYIQKDAPEADKKSNWLPAPNGPIYLVMRLYWPRRIPPPSILPAGEGTWQPPGVIVTQ
jgi:hypothetical protein